MVRSNGYQARHRRARLGMVPPRFPAASRDRGNFLCLERGYAMRCRPTTTSTSQAAWDVIVRVLAGVCLLLAVPRVWRTSSTTAMRTASRSNWKPRWSVRSKAPISWRPRTGDIIWCRATAEKRVASAGPTALDGPGMAARLEQEFTAERFRSYLQKPLVIGLVLGSPLPKASEGAAKAFFATWRCS